MGRQSRLPLHLIVHLSDFVLSRKTNGKNALSPHVQLAGSVGDVVVVVGQLMLMLIGHMYNHARLTSLYTHMLAF